MMLKGKISSVGTAFDIIRVAIGILWLSETN